MGEGCFLGRPGWGPADLPGAFPGESTRGARRSMGTRSCGGLCIFLGLSEGRHHAEMRSWPTPWINCQLSFMGERERSFCAPNVRRLISQRVMGERRLRLRSTRHCGMKGAGVLGERVQPFRARRFRAYAALDTAA